MPKLRKSLEDWGNDSLRAGIKCSLMMERGSDEYKDLAPIIGLHVNTVYNRIRNPNLFRLGELRKMFNTLHWTDEQILAIFGRGRR